MSGTLLPIPDDPRLPELIAEWPAYSQRAVQYGYSFPRSRWLKAFEDVLREHYPQANSRSLQLTARSVAPFELRDGHNVP